MTRKCQVGCTCGRHAKAGSRPCPVGCTCKKHALKGKSPSRKCRPGCGCGRHLTPQQREEIKLRKLKDRDYEAWAEQEAARQKRLRVQAEKEARRREVESRREARASTPRPGSDTASGSVHVYRPYGTARDLYTARDAELLYVGPAGCVAGETELWDPVQGKGVRFDELHRTGTRPWVQTLAGPVLAEVPFVKGVADLYEVSTSTGESVTVTADHLMLTPGGWRFAGQLRAGDLVATGSPAGECRCPGTLGDSPGRCSTGPGRCDPLLPSGSMAARDAVPPRSGAHGLARDDSPRGGPASTGASTRTCPGDGRHAMTDSGGRLSRGTSGETPTALATGASECCGGSGTLGPGSSSCPRRDRSRPAGRPLPPCASPCRGSGCTRCSGCGCSDRDQSCEGFRACGCTGRDCSDSCRLPERSLSRGGLLEGAGRSGRAELRGSLSSSCTHYRSEWAPVNAISYVRTDAYYDLHVPGEEHYLANRMWHHNTGKSRACLEKLHAMCLMNPGMRALIVRKTATSLTSTALVTYEEHVAKEHLLSGDVSWFGGSAKEAACYRYRNGSRINVGGMDKAMKIMSSEYDLCYVQEATELTEEDWEAITTRLRNGKVSFQQLMGDANPDVPTHWLRIRCLNGKTREIKSRHEDNPVLFDQDTGELTDVGQAYISKLDALSGVRYQRLRKGIWCAAEGLVYEEWDPELHLYKPMRRPPISWTRYVTVDFGYTNPMVVQFWAQDEDDRLYLYRELYQTKTTVDKMAPLILEAMNLKYEPRPRMVICDHDAEGRAVLERELGMSTKAAKKTVEDGIQAVKKRLRPSDVDGKPRLFICKDALVKRDEELYQARKPTCTEEEIVGYIWDRGGTKAQLDGKPPKEVPVKENDHGMDALRYAVAQLDLKSRPRVRSITY